MHRTLLLIAVLALAVDTLPDWFFAGSCQQYGCVPYNPSHDCQCNPECHKYGNCCADFKKQCFDTHFCKNYGCGSHGSKQYCQCDSACEQYNNCCVDYKEVCGGGGGGKPVECPKAPTTPGDRRTNKGNLRFVSYNVDFLFANASHSIGQLQCPGEGCEWTSHEIAAEHIKKIAQIIDRVDPDIASMQEVEDCYTLKKLLAQMTSAANYKPYLLFGTDTFTGENPGLVTKVDPFVDLVRSTLSVRYPVPGTTCTGSYTGSHGCSKHFVTRFKVPELGKTLSLITLHFLANPTDEKRCFEREAQAYVIAKLISEAKTRGDEIIVNGDFNDYSDKVKDSYNHKPISSVLKIIRTVGNLTNVAIKVPHAQRYTDWYDKDHDCKDTGGSEHSMIDHVLVSAGLFSRIKSVEIGHFYTETCPKDGFRYSDHWPVIVDFDLSK
eukprot:TRINITY_DN68193_c5_g2_i3.p1 TRINITY_DN68193_c5_g2~~TRINITY_DN68193_c5_g2_i3.p1  ORF type:complete len:444 (+),score=49.21 TRINITY_DN68193_c5_g2_i3:22-1332(+)